MPFPSEHPFFGRPRRVSRLYPVLALVFTLASSGLLYRWQLTQINADVAVQQRDREITTLKSQVENLAAQRLLDQATLDDQRTRLSKASDRLTSIEQQLQEKSSELDSKQAQLSAAQDQIKRQESQLSSNAQELEKLRTRPPLFNFKNESAIFIDVAATEAEIKTIVTDAYDYIQTLYDTPYLLNSITITFVDSFSIAGSAGEIIIENGPNGISIDIHLKDFDKNNFMDVNTLIHEVIHGFHGIAVLDSSALEEGITVAAADAVMERMIKDGKLPKYSSLYLSISDTQYNEWNHTLTVYKDNDTFYKYSQISKLYQLLGKAWFNLYREDSSFFKRFNQSYYAHIQKGESASDELVRSTIAAILPSVQGIPIKEYLRTNKAFNPVW